MKQQNVTIYRALLPLAFLYKAIVNLRNRCFDYGILKSQSFPIPVISVGNISVGGTGKTPHTEYLIRLLHEKFNVAVLSRGYKRKSKGFVLATTESTAKEIGDEPAQMKSKFPDIHIAVDHNRCRGINLLTSSHICPAPEVIILDDAFQHRYVQPGLSILLIDYNRPIREDKLLPAGRLRESASEQRRADIIILTKCPNKLTRKECILLKKKIAPLPRQQVYFSTLTYGNLKALSNPETDFLPENLLHNKHVLLVTGIASPQRLTDYLKQYTDKIFPLTFHDHHDFSMSDLSKIEDFFKRMPEGNRLILTTEKDAARLRDKTSLKEEIKSNIYIQPIETNFLEDKDLFDKTIIDYVRKNSRNSSLSQGKNNNPS